MFHYGLGSNSAGTSLLLISLFNLRPGWVRSLLSNHVVSGSILLRGIFSKCFLLLTPVRQMPVNEFLIDGNSSRAILKCKYESGFSYDRLVDDIKKKFLQNQTNVKFIVSRIGSSIQLALMDITGENSVIVGQKIYKDINDDIKHGGYKYIFSEVEIKVSGTPRNKKPLETTTGTSITKTPPTTTTITVSSSTIKPTEIETTTITTTQTPIQKTTSQDYRNPESGRNTKVEPSGGFSTGTVIGFTLGSLILLLLIVILLLLYRRGNMRNFANPFTSEQFFSNIHSRFINQNTVPLDDLPSPTYHNEGGFQNPVYGAETTNRLASGGNMNNACNQEFDNPLYRSDLNQETLFDDPSRISSSLSLEPNDPVNLQDSTI